MKCKNTSLFHYSASSYSTLLDSIGSYSGTHVSMQLFQCRLMTKISLIQGKDVIQRFDRATMSCYLS